MQTPESSSDARSEALGRVDARGSVAAGVAVVLVCLAATVLPALLRSGEVAFSLVGDQAVIPPVVYVPFFASLIAIGVLGGRGLRGARVAPLSWTAAASLPLLLGTVYAHRVLSPFAVGDSFEASLPYRAAALAAPHLLGAGAAASAALFATVVALWFTRLGTVRVESSISTPRFDSGSAIVAVICAGVVVYAHDPFRFEGQVNFDELAFARSVDVGISVGFALLAIGVPLVTAALRRFALLPEGTERSLRDDAAMVMLGATGFAACMVLVAVSDSRVRLLGQTATFQPYLGDRIWYGVFAMRVGVALVAAGAPFLLARRAGRTASRSLALSVTLLVVVFAGAAFVDREAAAREEHAFHKSLQGP